MYSYLRTLLNHFLRFYPCLKNFLYFFVVNEAKTMRPPAAAEIRRFFLSAVCIESDKSASSPDVLALLYRAFFDFSFRNKGSPFTSQVQKTKKTLT